MLRRLIIAFAATAVIGAAAIPTSASAYWHGHGWYGGWRGPGWGYPYAYVGGPYYYRGCYRNTRVWTPYGWRWRRVRVC